MASSSKRELDDNVATNGSKRLKGVLSDIQQKIEYSKPYRFFLSTIFAEEKTHDEKLTVSFPELLDEIDSSLQMSFVVEIEWLLAQYAVHNKELTPITLLYGHKNTELEKAMKDKTIPNLKATHIKPSEYGTHHTKMMILSYTNGSIRVIVTTGNLIEKDWKNATQGIWISPRLPRIQTDGAADNSDSETHFRRDLLHYLEEYRELPAVRREVEPWIQKVREADCREVKVFFVASAPGNHKAQKALLWGLTKMSRLLSEHAIVPKNEAKNWPLYYGCSSIGNLGASSSAWLLGEFTRTMQSSTSCSSITPHEVKLIYPCQEDVVSSHDGLEAGRCLPYMTETHNKQPWLKNYLCKWRSDQRHRTRAMPHIKTYSRVSPCQKYLSWFLLTSANVSKAAWGFDYNRTRRILNYEAGVLLIPQILIAKSRFPLTNQSPSEDGPQFCLPYDIPLVKYTEEDEPWLIDQLQDLGNRTWL